MPLAKLQAAFGANASMSGLSCNRNKTSGTLSLNMVELCFGPPTRPTLPPATWCWHSHHWWRCSRSPCGCRSCRRCRSTRAVVGGETVGPRVPCPPLTLLASSYGARPPSPHTHARSPTRRMAVFFSSLYTAGSYRQ